jgi:hypothetical protein
MKKCILCKKKISKDAIAFCPDCAHKIVSNLISLQGEKGFKKSCEEALKDIKEDLGSN